MSRNAIILAAGTSSRFVPLSQEIPKGLLEVKGEVLIERQIRQLKDAGIDEICVVVGYKAEMFEYLKNRYGVELVFNEDYARYNNTSSMIRILDKLGDTFICSSDNYFPYNVFKDQSSQSYYSALYASGKTEEYCLHTDDKDNVVNVSVGGSDSWYMIGHVYFSQDFSNSFKHLLMHEYQKEETRQGYWEDVYIKHIDNLPNIKINRYKEGDIQEFDSLDELRVFDTSYLNDTRSKTIKEIASRLDCNESDLTGFLKIPSEDDAIMFSFQCKGENFVYNSKDDSLLRT